MKALDSNAITKEDYEALASFRYTLRRFLAFSEQAARDVGLTPQHHQALLAIMGFPGPSKPSIGNLADALIIQHHSAVGLVNRLEAMGLAVREQDPADQRRMCLSLTKGGLEVLAKLSLVHRNEIDRVSPELIAFLRQASEAVE